MILCVTLNPSVDRTLFVEKLVVGDTNRVIRTEIDAGGKGVNLARVYSELSGEAIAIGFLAGSNGKFIEHVLNLQNVKHEFTYVQGETRTNISIEENSGHPPTTLNEKGPNVSSDDWLKFLETYSKFIEKCQFVTLGGSLPQGVNKNAFAELMERFPGKRFVVDADGEIMQFALQKIPFMIKPNADEAARLVGFEIATLDDAIKACKTLRVKSDNVLLSMGKDGAILSWEDRLWMGIPPTVHSVSTIGSGDSLLAGFLFGLETGEIEEAFRLGIACGAATAMTNGSEIGRKGTIDSLLSQVKVEPIAG